MVHRALVKIVEAVPLRYAVAFVTLLVVVYWGGIHPWMMNWGSTVAEREMALPGDDLYGDLERRSTQAITIDAPSEVVWQWLVQIGQDRAGFYSYTWLENLVGVDIHNADEIHPEWQQLAVGDAWRLVPADYLGGVGRDAITSVLMIEPGHALVLDLWGAFVIEPIDEHTSRLLVRSLPATPNALTTLLVDPLVFTMGRRMLLGLAGRAEGRPEAPTALRFIAQLGWAAAGVVGLWLFVSGRRRLYWLPLPVVAALPALVTSADLEAGLAAFLAVGITTLGFATFGRSWWGPFLVVGSLVMMTLLLAPDAYIAFGLAFALLLLVASGAWAAGRTTSRWRAHRSMTSGAGSALH
jgi:hypothetical protein